MYKRRMEMLEHMLLNFNEALPDLVDLDINDWTAKHPCGTVACIGGAACMYPPFMEEGLRLDARGYPSLASLGGTLLAYRALQAFFDLDYDDTHHLFDPQSWFTDEGDLPHVTPAMAATRVREIINLWDRVAQT